MATCRLLQFVRNLGCAICYLLLSDSASYAMSELPTYLLPLVFLGITLQGMKHFVHHGQFTIRQRLFDNQPVWIPVIHQYRCIYSKALYGYFCVLQVIFLIVY